MGGCFGIAASSGDCFSTRSTCRAIVLTYIHPIQAAAQGLLLRLAHLFLALSNLLWKLPGCTSLCICVSGCDQLPTGRQMLLTWGLYVWTGTPHNRSPVWCCICELLQGATVALM